ELMSTGDIGLASQVLQYAADPSIFEGGMVFRGKRGGKDTAIYVSDPVQAAKMASDLRLKGEYTPPGKSTIRLDERSSLRAEGLDIAAQQDALRASADRHLPNPADRRRFDDMVSSFDSRVARGDLPPAEAAASYAQLQTLLEAPAGKPLSKADHLRI